MSEKVNDYVSVNVEKIINDESLEFPKNMALACAWIMGNKKGLNLRVLNVKSSSSLSDYFILASASNLIQAKSMAEEIASQMKQNGFEILSKEGLDNSDWILIDIGDILIHIFLDTSREIYDLDGLWGNHPELEIPQDYYFSQPVEETSNTDNKSYF